MPFVEEIGDQICERLGLRSRHLQPFQKRLSRQGGGRRGGLGPTQAGPRSTGRPRVDACVRRPALQPPRMVRVSMGNVPADDARGIVKCMLLLAIA